MLPRVCMHAKFLLRIINISRIFPQHGQLKSMLPNYVCMLNFSFMTDFSTKVEVFFLAWRYCHGKKIVTTMLVRAKITSNMTLNPSFMTVDFFGILRINVRALA